MQKQIKEKKFEKFPTEIRKQILKETGWRKYKFKKFLTRQEQFEEHKFENFSDAQKQAVSDEEDKFENFLTLRNKLFLIRKINLKHQCF